MQSFARRLSGKSFNTIFLRGFWSGTSEIEEGPDCPMMLGLREARPCAKTLECPQTTVNCGSGLQAYLDSGCSGDRMFHRGLNMHHSYEAACNLHPARSAVQCGCHGKLQPRFAQSLFLHFRKCSLAQDARLRLSVPFRLPSFTQLSYTDLHCSVTQPGARSDLPGAWSQRRRSTTRRDLARGKPALVAVLLGFRSWIRK